MIVPHTTTKSVKDVYLSLIFVTNEFGVFSLPPSCCFVAHCLCVFPVGNATHLLFVVSSFCLFYSLLFVSLPACVSFDVSFWVKDLTRKKRSERRNDSLRHSIKEISLPFHFATLTFGRHILLLPLLSFLRQKFYDSFGLSPFLLVTMFLCSLCVDVHSHVCWMFRDARCTFEMHSPRVCPLSPPLDFVTIAFVHLTLQLPNQMRRKGKKERGFSVCLSMCNVSPSERREGGKLKEPQSENVGRRKEVWEERREISDLFEKDKDWRGTKASSIHNSQGFTLSDERG